MAAKMLLEWWEVRLGRIAEGRGQRAGLWIKGGSLLPPILCFILLDNIYDLTCYRHVYLLMFISAPCSPELGCFWSIHLPISPVPTTISGTWQVQVKYLLNE